MEMNSLGSSLESPRADFSNSVDNYTKQTNDVAKQLKEFEKRNADQRGLQTGLYKLLCQGDDLWDTLVSTGGKETAQALRRVIRQMNENLAEQDHTIESLESSIKLAVKTFEGLKASIKDVRSQHANVKENLHARVSAMKSLHPEISGSSQRSTSQDSKNSKERTTQGSKNSKERVTTERTRRTA